VKKKNEISKKCYRISSDTIKLVNEALAFLTVVFFELFEQCFSSVVEQVDGSIVQRSQDPWSVFVK